MGYYKNFNSKLKSTKKQITKLFLTYLVLCRYQDEVNADLPLLLKLASKVMFHEIAHLLGLKHCIYYKCIMNGSNHLKENLEKPFDFCPVCLRKVFWNLNFEILERYRQLYEFYRKEGNSYEMEKEWYEKRVKEGNM